MLNKLIFDLSLFEFTAATYFSATTLVELDNVLNNFGSICKSFRDIR
jgi:hypothetical protein